MNQTDQRAAPETLYNRSCDACRQHKVRCIVDDASASKICQRCFRTDRKCVFSQLQKRKPRKRTDTRVAELEREVQAMRGLFTGKLAGNEKSKQSTADQKNPESARDGFDHGSSAKALVEQNMDADIAFFLDPSSSGSSAASRADPIDLGVVTVEVAMQLFNTYVVELAPNCPTAMLPPNARFEQIRSSKPTLFLAIIAAAAGKSDPSLFSVLSSEAISAYTYRTVVHHEKCLELVQAMMTIATWYWAPGRFTQLKFYEYIHAAAIMALDIGLGANPNRHPRRGRKLEADLSMSPVSLESRLEDLERRRVFLGCYLMTTGVALSMRRPGLLRFNSWVSGCLGVISTSSIVLDQLLCYWVEIYSIAEDVFTNFNFDDEGAIADLSEIQVQFQLKVFQKRLAAWKLKVDSCIGESGLDVLMISYHYINTFAHEIAIHDEHPPEDFRPPFRVDKPISSSLISNDCKLTPAHVESIRTIITSAQAILDIFLVMDLNNMRAIPIYNYVRMAYACVVLTKLYTSTLSPESQIATVVNAESLRIKYYLNALIQRLSEAVGPMECRAPYTFLGLLMRMYAWFVTQETEPTSTDVPDPSATEAFMDPVADRSLRDLTTGSFTNFEATKSPATDFANGGPTYNSLDQESFTYDDTTIPFVFDMSAQMDFSDPLGLYDGLDPAGFIDPDWSSRINQPAGYSSTHNQWILE